MAEQEVIKHTKEVFKIWGNRNSSFWQKIKDFILEIIIIVIAISLSIWFNNKSEHRNEQKNVETFLLGLKTDLQSDIGETNTILDAYSNYKILYTYLSSLDKNKTPNKDSLKLAVSYVNSNTFLRAHKSRFTGFLSAGRILNIENDSLAMDILNYYQEVLPSVETSEKVWLDGNRSLITYLENNVKDFENLTDQFQVLTTPKGKYLTRFLIPWPQLTERYNDVISHANRIILEIDKEYKKSE